MKVNGHWPESSRSCVTFQVQSSYMFAKRPFIINILRLFTSGIRKVFGSLTGSIRSSNWNYTPYKSIRSSKIEKILSEDVQIFINGLYRFKVLKIYGCKTDSLSMSQIMWNAESIRSSNMVRELWFKRGQDLLWVNSRTVYSPPLASSDSLILRRGFKLILARWWSHPIRYRIRERQPIIARLQSISLKFRLSQLEDRVFFEENRSFLKKGPYAFPSYNVKDHIFYVEKVNLEASIGYF